jgi:hypothetical protein
MMDPITIYELGKARQREIQAEFGPRPCGRVIKAEARNLSVKRGLTLTLGSLALAALVFAQALAR